MQKLAVKPLSLEMVKIILNELANAFGDYPIEYIPERPGEVRESLNTDTKAYTMLGWKPKGDIIRYIKENYILDK